MAYDASRATNMFYAVTKSDTAENYGFGLYVGGAGNVALVPAKVGIGGTPVVFTALAAGSYIRDFAFCQVMSTNTTATDLVAFGPT